jgi:hypothetical protein
VAHRPTARQRLQHIRGEKYSYRSSVFCGPRKGRCYATHAKHILAYGVTSKNNRETVFSAAARAELLQKKRTGVFYVVRATHSDVFSIGSDQSLYNESLLVAREIQN